MCAFELRNVGKVRVTYLVDCRLVDCCFLYSFTTVQLRSFLHPYNMSEHDTTVASFWFSKQSKRNGTDCREG